jgi:hypothetical protein
MRRTLLAGVLLAVLVPLLAAASTLLALDTVWPVLLAAAAMLVPGGQVLPRLAALMIGATAGWVGFALRVGVLPDLPISSGIALAVAVLVVTAMAVASADRLPLWAGLAGIAAFSGVYELAYRATPAAFVSESAVAFTTLLLAAALGAAAGMLANAGAARAITAATTTSDTADLAEETI